MDTVRHLKWESQWDRQTSKTKSKIKKISKFESNAACHTHFGCIQCWVTHVSWVTHALSGQQAFRQTNGVAARLDDINNHQPHPCHPPHSHPLTRPLSITPETPHLTVKYNLPCSSAASNDDAIHHKALKLALQDESRPQRRRLRSTLSLVRLVALGTTATVAAPRPAATVVVSICVVRSQPSARLECRAVLRRRRPRCQPSQRPAPVDGVCSRLDGHRRGRTYHPATLYRAGGFYLASLRDLRSQSGDTEPSMGDCRARGCHCTRAQAFRR